MKPNFLLTLLCHLTIVAPCCADTFTLKDGSSFEAKVVSETPKTYLLEIKISKGITDERTVAKADVVNVQHERPDFKAFQAIAQLVPTPDFITAEDYLERIAQVEKFLADFNTASSVKDATVILTTLKKESAAISAGGFKVGGELITAAEHESNAYDLDAQIEEAKIRKSIEVGELVTALRLFSTLDADYPTTLSHSALVPLIRQVIQNETSEAKQSLATLPERLKARELGLSRMVQDDRVASQAAIQEEAAQLEARYEAETNSKIKWVSTDPFHKASLEDTVRLGEAEFVRLSTTKAGLGVEGGKSYREVYKAVHDGESDSVVTAAVSRARAAMVPGRYLTPLENRAKGRK